MFLVDSPFPISDYCCNKMKKEPNKKFQKETGLRPIFATMAEESKSREIQWMNSGCNGFESNDPISKPMSFWVEQDILQYYVDTKIPYCSVYGDILQDDKSGKLYLTGCKRTGCMFCMFGIMSEKSPNRFEQMKVTHPRQYDYCINGGCYRDDGMWVPDDKGLGIGKILDYIGRPY